MRGPVFFFFVQLAAVVTESADVGIEWLKLFSGSTDGVGRACLMPMTSYSRVIVRLISPAILFTLLLLSSALHRIISAKLSSCDILSLGKLVRLLGPFSARLYIRGAISLALTSYSSLASVSLSYLQCVPAGHVHVVLEYPEIICGSHSYRTLLVPIALVIALVVVGFPLSLGAYLFHHRRRYDLACNRSSSMFSPASESSDVARDFEPNQVARASDLLTEGFRPACFFWQPVLLLFRAIAVVITVSLAASAVPGWKYSLLTMFFLALLLLHVHTRPFQDSHVNVLMVASLALLLTASSILTVQPPPVTDTLIRWPLICLITVPAIAMVLLRMLQAARGLFGSKARRAEASIHPGHTMYGDGPGMADGSYYERLADPLELLESKPPPKST